MNDILTATVIIVHHIRNIRDAIGKCFMLKDDNAFCLRGVFVDYLFVRQWIHRMEWQVNLFKIITIKGKWGIVLNKLVCKHRKS